MTETVSQLTRRARVRDIPQLVALMRDYCAFYEARRTDAELEGLVRHLFACPSDGVQLVSTDRDGRLTGFVTLYWSWSTIRARKIAIMNDLFVADSSRQRGIGRQLIASCVAEARAGEADRLTWQTRPSNTQAQALYTGVGAEQDQWLDFFLALDDEGRGQRA